jgi:hypothetical protein
MEDSKITVLNLLTERSDGMLRVEILSQLSCLFSVVEIVAALQSLTNSGHVSHKGLMFRRTGK